MDAQSRIGTPEVERSAGLGARSERARYIAWLGIGTAVLYTAALLHFIVRNAHFFGDDYTGFWLATRSSLTESLWVPVGGQLVPLSRAVNHLFYHAFGVNYWAALTVMLGLHAAGVFYFWRALQMVRPSAFHLLLVALFCSYIDLWTQVTWWSQAIQRLPYVACTMAATYHYLRYRQTRARAQLVIVCILQVVALGFYVKAVLLPIWLVAVELASASLDDARRTRPLREVLRPRREWWLFAALALASALYVVVAHRVLVGPQPHGNMSPLFQLKFVAKSLWVFAHTMFTIALGPQDSGRPILLALLGGFIVYTLYRARGVWIAWVAAIGLLVLNMLMIGLSIRVGVFGDIMVFEHRYYYDVYFIALFFLAVVVHHLPRQVPELRWLRSTAAPVILAGAAVVLHAGVSYFTIYSSAFQHTQDFPRARAYYNNFAPDLASLPPSARVADGQVPVFVAGLDLNFNRLSQLAKVLGSKVRFVREHAAEYRVAPDGHILPVRKRRELESGAR